MTKAKDGELLVRVRTGCLKKLYEQSLFTGFRGRCNGSRARTHPSPVPGSNIVLGNATEVVVIHQDDHGRGRLVITTYQTVPGPSPLRDEVIAILSAESDLPFTTVP